MNLPAKCLSGYHGHHMLDSKKNHNPSDGVKKSLTEQRFETRKTITLCAGCHLIITHDEEEEEKLVKKFADLGYYIDKATGEIQCKKNFDGFCVVIE